MKTTESRSYPMRHTMPQPRIRFGPGSSRRTENRMAGPAIFFILAGLVGFGVLISMLLS